MRLLAVRFTQVCLRLVPLGYLLAVNFTQVCIRLIPVRFSCGSFHLGLLVVSSAHVRSNIKNKSLYGISLM